MQTFLTFYRGHLRPFLLDDARLRKQLVEVMQIYHANENKGPAHIWNHPAAIMWRGHSQALIAYGAVVATHYYLRFDGAPHKSAAEILDLRNRDIKAGCVYPYEPMWYYDKIVREQHLRLLAYKWANSKRPPIWTNTESGYCLVAAGEVTPDPRRVYAKPVKLGPDGWGGYEYTLDWRE